MASRNLLLVEGTDDLNVLHHLLVHYNIRNEITIENKQGDRQLLENVKVQLKISDDDAITQTIGVIIDADTDMEARWQSVRNILVGAGYISVPNKPLERGTIIREENRITVGIWIMPDNRITGKLEDFVRFLVPENDKLWKRAEGAVARIPVTHRMFTQSDTIKAHIHTWLAWQKEPGKPMGQAITKRYLDAEAPHALQLIAWIRQLFGLL